MTHWRYILHTKYLKFFNNLNVKGLGAKKSTLQPYEKLNCVEGGFWVSKLFAEKLSLESMDTYCLRHKEAN